MGKTKKSVSFAPYSLIVSERREYAPNSPQKAAAKAIERCRLPDEIKQLDIPRLMKIKRFIKYTGYKFMQGEGINPILVFAVEYKTGGIDLVECGRWIEGYPPTYQDAFLLHTKIQMAKTLVDRGDWRYIEDRFRHSRAEMMKFQWLDDMRFRIHEGKRPKSRGWIISEEETAQRERYERSLAGRVGNACKATKRVFGACAMSLMPASLRRRLLWI
ncbi:hypothetical protein BJY01DRAFT_255685 [Aspergillus pseudoustus]|uniref:Uncharacterized protein n=1 Tax=Aspergillus pseudoustus TaxID=1810923 RepID=A0ABR4II74_9EURO